MTKEEIYRETDGGLDVFKYYIPNIPNDLKKKFRLRDKTEDNTPSTSLKRGDDGIYTIMDFGSFDKPKNCIDYVSWSTGQSFAEAIKQIVSDLNLALHGNQKQVKIEQPVKQNLTDLNDKMLAYMEGRGISQFTLRQEQIGMQQGKFMVMAGRKIDVLSFPYFDKDGELVNYKHRGFFLKDNKLKRAFQQEKNAKQVFYGINSITDKTSVIVFVEGEIDRLSVLEAFLEHENKDELACLSVPNGAKSLGQIDECWDVIKSIERFIIFVDNDNPGKELKDELVRRIGSAKCQVVTKLPQGCKDANDVLKNYGKEEVVRVILESEFIKVDGLFEFKEFFDDADFLFSNGLNTGITFDHLPVLGKILSFDTNQFTIITGIPGHGKSTWLNDVQVNLARNGWRSAIFTPETSHAKFQIRNFSENYAGKIWPSSKSAKMPENVELVMTSQEYQQTKEFINEHFFWVEPRDYDIDSILEKMAASVFRNGVNSIVLDPFNRIGKPKGFKGDKLDQINEILTKLNRFKREFNVHIFLVAHPRKMQKNRIYTNNKGSEDEYSSKIWDVADLYDIAHSSDFYNQTDIGITVYRNSENGGVEIHVNKMKMEDYGETGIGYLKFHKETRRYTEDGVTQPPIIGQSKERYEEKQIQILGPGSVDFTRDDDDEIPF